MNTSVVDFIKRRFPLTSTSNWINKNCFYFAMILKERFNGIIIYETYSNRFMVMINGYLYDANGVCYKLSKRELDLFSRNTEIDLEFDLHIINWDAYIKRDSVQKEEIFQEYIN